MGYYITQQEIRELATSLGWTEEVAKDPTLMIFNRIKDEDKQQVNIWWTRMTVGTSLNHPKMGKSQLFRKHVNRETLKKILENPRVHTQIGYYTKEQFKDIPIRNYHRRQR